MRLDRDVLLFHMELAGPAPTVGEGFVGWNRAIDPAAAPGPEYAVVVRWCTQAMIANCGPGPAHWESALITGAAATVNAFPFEVDGATVKAHLDAALIEDPAAFDWWAVARLFPGPTGIPPTDLAPDTGSSTYTPASPETVLPLDIYMCHRYISGRHSSLDQQEANMGKRPARVKDLRFRADANGCLSRPAFEGAVIAALKREPVATLVHLDLDGLLVLNEKAGREAGDKAIGTVIAALSKTASKEGWTLGRIGGDEFALLAPATTLEPVFLRAEQLRQELDAALAKAVPRGQTCTVSIGVANTPRDTKSRGPASAEELMRKADLALLAAKEQGGDAVGLTPSDDMVLKSSYYSAAQLGRLKGLAERQKKKEAALLREALDDLLRKHERS